MKIAMTTVASWRGAQIAWTTSSWPGIAMTLSAPYPHMSALDRPAREGMIESSLVQT